MDYKDLLRGKTGCVCGKDHFALIKKIIVKKNALMEIPGLLDELSVKDKIHIIADKTTYEVAGEKVLSLVKDKFNVTKTVFENENLITDAYAFNQVLSEIPDAVNMIIAVGSGTINDISRYVSDKSGIPYIIVATAPSMDGYASPVIPMIIDGFKISYEASSAVAIVGDTDILSASPYNMILAGFGDIIGKYTSLADWKLANLLSGEYHCPFIESLVRQSLELCVSTIDGLIKRDKAAIETLTDALIISGLAMLFAGNSRPASGAEHHLAHFWEIYFLQRGGKQPLHGEKVGIACVIMSGLYNQVRDGMITIHPENRMSDDKKTAGIKRIYGKQAQTIIDDNFSDGKISIDLKIVSENISEIRKIASSVPDSAIIRSYLKKLGAFALPEELGIDSQLKNDGLKFSMYMRKLITILRLYDAIGMEVT